MKNYTIIGGVNGVGKSSFTGVLKSQKNDLGIIVDIDKITNQMGGKSLMGGKQAIHIMENCIREGICFTQETTLSGHHLKATVQRAMDAGFYIQLYYIGLDTAEESKRRIANRVDKGGHNIDAKVVERRFLGRWTAVQAVLPYCDKAVFYDNDNGFVEVAAYCSGELTLKGDCQPKWIMELSEYLQDLKRQENAMLRYEKLSMRRDHLSHRIMMLSEYVMTISEHLRDLEKLTVAPYRYEDLLMRRAELSDRIMRLSTDLQYLEEVTESLYRSLKMTGKGVPAKTDNRVIGVPKATELGEDQR